MAALALPLLEGVGELLAAAWTAFTSSGAASAVAGGVATGAVLSLPGDTAKDKDKAKTETGAATRTQSRNCKCPPDRGQIVTRNLEYVTDIAGISELRDWLCTDD
ncbi:hypothetical protein [Caballeronia sp. LZ016]|uniref:hypothetical protein n=1 Tax=Caballeronia sp. LZ016 TaxID=3038554 RepID=UPI00285F0F74|nr:hypothetical protein [Caballeronia sp. LZ016]MDR5738072.1 hypothetical protein [Caballeronia sp. LZ016]